MPLGAHIKCMVKEVDDATETPYKIVPDIVDLFNQVVSVFVSPS